MAEMSASRSETNPRRAAPRKAGVRAALVALALLLLAAVPSVAATPADAQRADDLVLIIARSTNITDIPSSVLRTAFLGLRAEYKDVRLIPLNLPLRTSSRERLDRALLGLEPDEVGNFWVDQRVRDGRNPPRSVPNEELAVRVVGQLPGAIAYVPARLAESQVRALRIDGKGPTDTGYLLSR
jgi:hypothetical protein